MLVQKVNIYPPGTKVSLAKKHKNKASPFDTQPFAYVHSYQIITEKNAEKSSGWCKHKFRGEGIPHLALHIVAQKKLLATKYKRKYTFVLPADQVIIADL